MGEIDDGTLGALFGNATAAGVHDLSEPTVQRYLLTDEATALRARALMQKWNTEASNSPSEFLSVYSAAVYITDPASRATIAQLGTGLPLRGDPARHAAQFLLRTNVAMELAASLSPMSMPYHPHSYRAPYVVSKLHLMRRSSQALASVLVRDLEDKVARTRSSLRKQPLALFGGFATLGDDAPLVLAVSLSGARDPDDVLKRALEIRDGSAARRYRKWVRHILAAIESRDVKKQVEANDELLAARQVLSDELRRLYGLQRTDIVGATAKVASSLDLDALATFDLSKSAMKALSEVIKGAPTARNWVQSRVLRHRIALLVQLARGARAEAQLNGLLKRAFGVSMSERNLKRFRELRRMQIAAARAVVGEK
jgi:hypothetical protein